MNIAISDTMQACLGTTDSQKVGMHARSYLENELADIECVKEATQLVQREIRDFFNEPLFRVASNLQGTILIDYRTPYLN